MWHELLQDVRFGLYRCYKMPRVTAIIVICIALGVGPNAILFQVVNNALLRSIDVDEPERLAALCMKRGGDPDSEANPSLTYPDLERIDRQIDLFSQVVGISMARVAWQQPQKAAETAQVQMVSSAFFEALGRDPIIGDVFRAEQIETPGSKPFLVLSHGFWQSRLGSDPQIVGQMVRVNDFEFRVLGVMGPDFHGANMMGCDMWAPIVMVGQLRPGQGGRLRQEGHSWVTSFARLKPGTSFAEANTALASFSRRMAETMPESHEGRHFSIRAYNNLGGHDLGEIQTVIVIIHMLVGLVLLVACASVGSLLLARSTARRQEIAMRLALGATRGRVIRQLLTEGFLLALLGTLLGLLASAWCTDLLESIMVSMDLPIGVVLKFDWRSFAFALGLAVIATLVFALAPAFQVTRGALLPALKDQPGGIGAEFQVSRLRNLFTSAQFAISLVLLIVAGLFVRSLQRSSLLDPGFNLQHTLRYTIEPGLYGYLGDELKRFVHNFRNVVKGVPGVVDVSLSRLPPLASHRTSTRGSVIREDLSTDQPFRCGWNLVDPRFFGVNGIELVAGRGFREGETTASGPVCVINETLARRYYGNQDPLGRHLSVFSSEASEIVGVARDSKYFSIGEDPIPFVYVPIPEVFSHEATFCIRVEGDVDEAHRVIREAVAAAFPNLILDGLTTTKARVRRALDPVRLAAAAFSGLGLLALTLAMVGVFGMIAYSVQLRRQEVGVRLSLGGHPHRLVWLLMKRGLVLVAVGSLIGLVLAFLVAGQLQSILIETSPYDIWAYIPPLGFLLTVALMALFLPARKMVYREPMRALRYE